VITDGVYTNVEGAEFSGSIQSSGGGDVKEETA